MYTHTCIYIYTHIMWIYIDSQGSPYEGSSFEHKGEHVYVVCVYMCMFVHTCSHTLYTQMHTWNTHMHIHTYIHTYRTSMGTPLCIGRVGKGTRTLCRR